MKVSKCKAFTLIELLVVISIIAMLMAILMPALSKAREQAKKIVCGNHYRQQSLGVTMYAESNNSYVPIVAPTPGYWAWDISFWTTDMISQYGGIDDNEVFFCPANKDRDPQDGRVWQYSWINVGTKFEPLKSEAELTDSAKKGFYRVLPSLFTFDRLDVSGKSLLNTGQWQRLQTGERAQWIRKVSAVSRPSEWPMVMDAIISERGSMTNFFEITSGGSYDLMGLYDRSNHKSKRKFDTGEYKPAGANIAFTDGHVEWRDFDEMAYRLDWGQYFWW
ncbi:MAG: type II secretion system protein [Phycisphaerae bacterium]